MAIETFKKKPVIVEAVRFHGWNYEEVSKFVGEVLKPELESETAYVAGVAPPIFSLSINTDEGVVKAFSGDWVIKEPLPPNSKKITICKSHVFENAYEVVCQ